MTFEQWLEALEQRHLANLTLPELTRALRAVSSAYVERRHTVGRGGPLESAGKRAAFALFYAPLHFLTARHVIEALDHSPAPASIADVGCGTGAAGAAWSVLYGGSPAITGIDRHPWAVDEARWTYRTLGLKGSARQGDLARSTRIDSTGAAIAAYVLNELSSEVRNRVIRQMVAAAERGARVLVLEPIARRVTPWWDEAVSQALGSGGRADEWRFPIPLPPLLQTLDHAAGLNHRELTARSIWLPGGTA